MRERRRRLLASGGGFPGGGDKRPPGDGRQSPQPVRRQQTPRRYARKRHFLNQTVGPGKVEILVVIVETGPADIIDETLRGNAAISQNDLVVLKLHMPPGEFRRHVLKRQEADRGSVLRQRAGVDQHIAEQQGVIGVRENAPNGFLLHSGRLRPPRRTPITRRPDRKAADLPNRRYSRREPIFNIATVVAVVIAACAGIHVLRAFFLTPRQDFDLLVRAAFIPARYSGRFDIDIYAWTSPVYAWTSPVYAWTSPVYAWTSPVYAWTSPVTYSLLHGDVFHLAINTIWLAAFGSPLANRIGAVRFCAFWVATSAAAVLLHTLVHAGDATMVIGASGAVSGMMAAAARFGFAVDRRSRRPAFSGAGLPLSGVVRRRNVVVFLAVWFAVNLIAGLGYLAPGEARSIAWEAHIGGFLCGFFTIGLFDRRAGFSPV